MKTRVYRVMESTGWELRTREYVQARNWSIMIRGVVQVFLIPESRVDTWIEETPSLDFTALAVEL